MALNTSGTACYFFAGRRQIPGTLRLTTLEKHAFNGVSRDSYGIINAAVPLDSRCDSQRRKANLSLTPAKDRLDYHINPGFWTISARKPDEPTAC